VAKFFADRGVSPDMISLSGIVFAALGATALVVAASSAEPASQRLWLLAAAVSIQLRLLANMLDGLVAVEGGLGGPLGGIFNEVPDRIEDILLIVPAGALAMAAPFPGGVSLGWAACVLALLTAYVRALGSGIGAGHPFHGPMAKPHRMFLLTLGCLVAAIAAEARLSGEIFYGTLVIMIAGMVVTIARRLKSMAAVLRS
jgi:phosphatidylglycerophosphate synthase